MRPHRPQLRALAFLAFWALFAPLALLACGHGPHSGEPGRTDQEDYEEAEWQMQHDEPETAIKLLEHIRTRYPFSKYVPLSELRLADLKMKQGHYPEAADAFQQFLKAHPTHEQADYAAYQLAVCYWKQGPSKFFLLPPDHERDLGEVREAAKGFEDFIKKYPDSKLRPEAEKRLAEVQGLLMEHEWYVVDFYKKRGRWPGVAARLEGLLKTYPGGPQESEVLYQLADAYLHLDDRFRAQQALQEIIVKHPNDPQRGPAEKLLASLR
jgi:outer membrane protein assembly factor BamD